jgi:hypothetical protein
MASRLCRDLADIQRLREKELAVLSELGCLATCIGYTSCMSICLC